MKGANTESFASLEDLYQCKLRREATEVKSSLPFVTNERTKVIPSHNSTSVLSSESLLRQPQSCPQASFQGGCATGVLSTKNL